MKHSKTFLGVTTCILAIAGVTAAKRFDSNKVRWYCTNGNTCVPVHKTCLKTITGLTCTVHFGSPITTVRTVYTVGSLDVNLNSKACDDLTNCIIPLIYTKNNWSVKDESMSKTAQGKLMYLTLRLLYLKHGLTAFKIGFRPIQSLTT